MSKTENYRISNLELLEAESIYILREVASEFENPVMLYSVGKDSSVMVRLAQKAFYPGHIPFPLLHVDTGFKFPEMYAFRDHLAATSGITVNIFKSLHATERNINPYDTGTIRCCNLLKTEALLEALEKGGYDAAIGGARRDEEKSRAKERVYSFRDKHGQWEPKNQRPELWNLYNGSINQGESIRVFPLSNWTELDIWIYIYREKIPVVPLYLASKRPVVRRNGQIIPVYPSSLIFSGEKEESISCRFRTLGCIPCTGAVESSATTIQDVIAEMMVTTFSERVTRIIDHDRESSMEQKKREGYF